MQTDGSTSILCYVPHAGKKASYRRTCFTCSSLQSVQGRETLEEALRQGSEGVLGHVPLGNEGRGDEPRRDDTLATDNFLPPYMAINKAWPAHQDGQGRYADALVKFTECSPPRNHRGTIAFKGILAKISTKPTTNNAQLRVASFSLNPCRVPRNTRQMVVSCQYYFAFVTKPQRGEESWTK